jgi:hypothetical protein
MPAGGDLTVSTRGHEGGAELVVGTRVRASRPRSGRASSTLLHHAARPPGARAHRGREVVVLPRGRAARRSGLALAPEAARRSLRVAARGGDARPHLAGAASRRIPPRPKPGRSRTGSVLVVEEEEGIRTEVLDTLMALGHRVEAATPTPRSGALGQGGSTSSHRPGPSRSVGLQLASAVRSGVPGRRWCCSPDGAAGSTRSGCANPAST